jgi:ABC-2 type transport system ATP-binding protein
MRQRTKLATTFAHDPEVLFLDEPLTGLDPLWRHRVQKALHEAADGGACVIFSSHVLHEVEQATRQVLLLHRGRLVAQGDAREIRALVDTYPHRVHIEARRPRDLGVHLLGWDVVESVTVVERGVRVTTPRPDAFYARLTAEAADGDLGVEGLVSPDDSLQALFETLVWKK